MKNILLILATLLLIIPTIASAAVTCSSCTTASCTCSVSDCASGNLRVYTSSSCSGVPTDSISFTGSSGIWYPTSGGTFYIKPFCEDKTIATNCNSVSVSSSQCGNQEQPCCANDACNNGLACQNSVCKVNTTTTTTQGGSFGCRAVAHVCTQFSVCCPGLNCVDGLCRASLTVTTASTTSTSTATLAKNECPFECCDGESQFYDNGCDAGFECVNNYCEEKATVSEPEPTGNEFPWGLILPIALVVILVPLFIFFFVFKKKQDDWKKLYEKWKRPRSAYR